MLRLISLFSLFSLFAIPNAPVSHHGNINRENSEIREKRYSMPRLMHGLVSLNSLFSLFVNRHVKVIHI